MKQLISWVGCKQPFSGTSFVAAGGFVLNCCNAGANTLKIILYVFFCMLCSCNTIPKTQKNIAKLDILVEARKYVDSLRLNDIDTVLIFYKGCRGCFLGYDKEAYIFWKQGNQNLVSKQGIYSPHRRKFICSPGIIDFYYSHSVSMNEELTEPSTSFLHYSYSLIELSTKDSIVYINELPDYYRTPENVDKSLLRWLYFIEGSLFNL